LYDETVARMAGKLLNSAARDASYTGHDMPMRLRVSREPQRVIVRYQQLRAGRDRSRPGTPRECLLATIQLPRGVPLLEPPGAAFCGTRRAVRQAKARTVHEGSEQLQKQRTIWAMN